MDTLWRKQNIITRSITPENPTGEKGRACMAEEGYASYEARDLGKGWKVDPFLNIPAKTEKTIAHITGPGMIKHMIMVPLHIEDTRSFVMRIYWDGANKPAVETPVGDFFASANVEHWQIDSLLVGRGPRTGMNCYFEMPYRKECRVTMENLNEEDHGLAFQIDYELRDIPEDMLYFHAQFYRANPLPYKEVFPIVEKIEGKGCYIGVYMVWGVSNNGWWGEGQVKFYIDGDQEYPTICGCGAEDYFGGSFNFDPGGHYQEFSGPYTGFYRWNSDKLYTPANRFSMYRWHVTDPVYFEKDLRVTVHALGWRSGRRYLPLQAADISCVAYFYLDTPSTVSRPLPDADGLEII